MTDPATLRKRIAELEAENRELRSKQDGGSIGSKGFSTMGNKGSGNSMPSKDWMNFSGGALERPTTANTANQSQQLKDIQEELKFEKKDKKKLTDQVEDLKRELQKQQFSSFTSSSSSISVTSGRLPPVPGVREISLEDIEVGEQISQGGFSTIHKGTLNGTTVAIKKIFDPRLTEELLNEIYNEIVMQSILRHPNIALLMGVVPKIPQIVIAFEYMSQGSLFNLLHHKKSQIQLSMESRIKMAKETAVVFLYMHQLGIVHRDIKSHNVLIDEHNNVKVCDFGLARFKVQYSNWLTHIG